MHGIGSYMWPDGREYRGKYWFDQKDGFGIMKKVTGDVVMGHWVQGECEKEEPLLPPDSARSLQTDNTLTCDEQQLLIDAVFLGDEEEEINDDPTGMYAKRSNNLHAMEAEIEVVNAEY